MMGPLEQIIDESKSILISTHLLPDGDGLGAEVALFHYLKKSGKKCQVLNPDPLPKRYQFLDPKKQFLFSTVEKKMARSFDLWIILDTHDPRRLGSLWDSRSNRFQKIVFLDHHPRPKGKLALKYPFNTSVISQVTASSIGELLYQLFEKLNFVPLDPQIALGLYVSVMTDTNSFRYARTTSSAHQIAGQMIEYGLNPEEIYQHIYSSKTASHLRLLGILLQNVKISKSGKVAWIEMNRSLRSKYKATADETLSFLNLLLLIREAEVICFFREEDDGKTRVSIKSKGKIIISQLAMKLGGGGHDYAAGLALSTSLRQTRLLVISQIEKLIKTQGNNSL
jgi:phosphoesterase RecJ-like protein